MRRETWRLLSAKTLSPAQRATSLGLFEGRFTHINSPVLSHFDAPASLPLQIYQHFAPFASQISSHIIFPPTHTHIRCEESGGGMWWQGTQDEDRKASIKKKE